jgi:acyl-CoA synthetase (AMP-forming)/AMP-acid ligase II/S-methylmethionine-dependent homocysteine/selenocysteine methylase
MGILKLCVAIIAIVGSSRSCDEQNQPTCSQPPGGIQGQSLIQKGSVVASLRNANVGRDFASRIGGDPREESEKTEVGQEQHKSVELTEEPTEEQKRQYWEAHTAKQESFARTAIVVALWYPAWLLCVAVYFLVQRFREQQKDQEAVGELASQGPVPKESCTGADLASLSTALQSGDTVVSLIEKRAKEQPNALAVKDADAGINLTYKELVDAATALALQLSRAGIAEGMTVVLVLPPSARLAVATLGVMKAGAAWLPLDRRSPPARLRELASQVVGGHLVLSSGGSDADKAAVLSIGLPVWCMDLHGELEGAEKLMPVCNQSKATKLSSSMLEAAPIFCTSGSSGMPKAVVYSSNVLLHGVLSFAEMCSMDRSTVVLLKTVPSWAVIEYEVFPPLVAGGCIVAHEQSQWDTELLADTVSKHSISVLISSGPVLKLLADGAWMSGAPACLQHAVNVGNSMLLSVCAGVLHDSVSLHNLYGCTEGPCCYWTVPAGRHLAAPDDAKSNAPAGRPQAGAEVHILDSKLEPVPWGSVGEVCFGGPFLSKGYLGDKEMNSAKFPLAPWNANKSAKTLESTSQIANAVGQGLHLLRSGDLGQWVTDPIDESRAVLRLVGRADRQLNIAGNRTSPEEIEAVISSVSRVDEASVVAGRGASGEEGLVAFCVGSGGRDLEAKIKAHCVEHLPKHACPALIVISASLPRLGNGKVDIQALTAQASLALDSVQEEAMSSLGLMEKTAKESIIVNDVMTVGRAFAIITVMLYHWHGHADLENLVDGAPFPFTAMISGIFEHSRWPMTLFVVCSGIQDRRSFESSQAAQWRQDLLMFILLVMTGYPLQFVFQFIHTWILRNDGLIGWEPVHDMPTTARWYFLFYILCRMLQRLAFGPLWSYMKSWSSAGSRAGFQAVFVIVVCVGFLAMPNELARVNPCKGMDAQRFDLKVLMVFWPGSFLKPFPSCPLDPSFGLAQPLFAVYTFAWWFGPSLFQKVPRVQGPMGIAFAILLAAVLLCGFDVYEALPTEWLAKLHDGYRARNWPWDLHSFFHDQLLVFVFLAVLMQAMLSGGGPFFRWSGLIQMGRASLTAYWLHLLWQDPSTLFESSKFAGLRIADYVIIPSPNMLADEARNLGGWSLAFAVMIGYSSLVLLTYAQLWQWLTVTCFQFVDGAYWTKHYHHLSAAVSRDSRLPARQAPVVRCEEAWRKWRALLADRCDRGRFVCLDGGVGTEVERATVDDSTVHPEGWSCLQWKTHPEVLRGVHEAYFKAGADIAIANTYATNRNVMRGAHCEECTEQATKVSLRLAKEARDATAMVVGELGGAEVKCSPCTGLSNGPLVAGSISCHPPGMAHGASMDKGQWPEPEVESAGYEEQAQLLRGAGADAVFVEMVWDWSCHGRKAVSGASHAGLPVAVCLSVFDGEGCKGGQPRLSDGTLVEEVARELAQRAGPWHVEAILIHHTKLPLVLPCLEAIRRGGWQGPLGCYPDHGTFKMPHWCFDDLEADAFLKHAAEWAEKTGCTMFGGCCGIGPETICKLSDWCQQHNRSVDKGA